MLELNIICRGGRIVYAFFAENVAISYKKIQNVVIPVEVN